MERKTVGDVMVRRLATVPPDATLLQVRDLFAHVRFHHLLVVEDGRLVGLISDRDVLRTVSPFFGTVNEQPRDAALMARKVHQIMTRQPICATPKIPLADAVRTMFRRRISALPVIMPDSGALVGLMTWKDVVRAYMPEAFTAPAKDESPAVRDSARGYVRAAASTLPAGEGDVARPTVAVSSLSPVSPAPSSSSSGRSPSREASGASGATGQGGAGLEATRPVTPIPAPRPAAGAAAAMAMNPGETSYHPAPEIMAVIAAAAAEEARQSASVPTVASAPPRPRTEPMSPPKN